MVLITTALLLGAKLNARLSTRRSEEHTSELQSQSNLVCRLLLEKKKRLDRSDLAGHGPNLGDQLVQKPTIQCGLRTNAFLQLGELIKVERAPSRDPTDRMDWCRR